MRVIFTYVRMNPVTVGHDRLVGEIVRQAKASGSSAYLYLSQSHDADRNPLNPEYKLGVIQKRYPGVTVKLAKNVFEAGQDMASEGFKEAVMVVGADRYESFGQSLSKYVGTEVLPLEKIDVEFITRGEEEASATKARLAALNGDIEGFAALVGSNEVHELYEAVREGMGAK